MVMKRFGAILVATALLLFSPCASFSQVPGLPSLGDFESLEFGNITVKPSAKIGYRAASVRVSFPVYGFVSTHYNPPGWSNSRPLDLTIKRADLLVGSVAMQVDTMSTIYLFGEATGNLPRNLNVAMPVSPWVFPAANELNWRGRRLQWWLLDFGGGCRLADNFSFLLGFRIDHISVGLGDPEDTIGTLDLDPGDTLTGDIRTKMWVPYVGISLSGDAYQARLIGSPVTWGEVKLPLQLDFNRGPGFFDSNQELSHTLFASGWYVGFDAAHRAFSVGEFVFNIWASGSYSIIRGNGQYTFKLPVFGHYFSEQATSTFVTSSISCGLSANLDF
jgi:hypothetical protein